VSQRYRLRQWLSVFDTVANLRLLRLTWDWGIAFPLETLSDSASRLFKISGLSLTKRWKDRPGEGLGDE
jgi:hypothetical protein